MDAKPITFTATEIEGLEGIMSAGHKWLDGSTPAYPTLILKLGRAFLEVQNESKPQELYLNEMEAWYLREIVPSNMRIKGEPAGVSIKKKLYPLLLDFEAERFSMAAGSKYGFSDIDEPLTRRDALPKAEAQEPESTLEDMEGISGPLLSEAEGPVFESSEEPVVSETERPEGGRPGVEPEDTSPDHEGQDTGENVDVDSAEINRDQPSE